MSKTIKFTYLLAIFFAAILVLSSLFGGGINVYAATSAYSDVLDDLQKDESFNVDDYPEIADDYSLQVIQIAESVDNELFIYVYQPSGQGKDLRASSISISTAINENLSYRLYDLILLSSSGVFYKYLVNDLTVKPDAVRYYDISEIFRPWINGIDISTENDNEINEVTCSVGNLWTACTINNEVLYYCEIVDVVTVTDKYVGFLRYTEGYWLWKNACDSHFVAFATDYNIDYLYDVDVYYKVRDCSHGHANITNRDTYKYGDYKECYVTLNDTDEGHTTVSGLGGVKHNWSRIQTVSEFKTIENLTVDTENQLEGKQWVLRFLDTSYSKYLRTSMGGTVGYDEYYSEVSEVTILRLHFKFNEQEYNLGVVDNKQAGSLDPNNSQPEFDFWQWLANLLGVPKKYAKLIFAVIICLSICSVALPILSAIFPVVGDILKKIFDCIWIGTKYFFIGLWWLISLPFRGIIALIRKIRG